MSTYIKSILGTALGVLALLGPGSSPGHALPPAVGLAFNPYIHPFAAANVGLSYGALSGMGLGNRMGMGRGNALGYGGWGGGAGGYGGGLGGFGAANPLATAAVGGASFGYGYGLGMVQWMRNPYQGYLQGVADITRSQGEAQRTIQEARLLREESRRSTLKTRRAAIEEADWERAHMPDPEKIRQRELARELDRARVSPPLSDIWSARSPNALLGHLVSRQGEGTRGPTVLLEEETLKQINLSTGDTHGSIGLLKDGGHLDWPTALKKPHFKEAREIINERMLDAYNNLSKNRKKPAPATLNDLQVNLNNMKKILVANPPRINERYLEANRYLENIAGTVRALQDPDLIEAFNSNWLNTTRDVGTLIKNMAERGLVFAPATPKSESAYLALYNALVEFDARMPPAPSTGSRGNR